jgi:hypothetical protein
MRLTLYLGVSKENKLSRKDAKESKKFCHQFLSKSFAFLAPLREKINCRVDASEAKKFYHQILSNSFAFLSPLREKKIVAQSRKEQRIKY